MSEFLSIAEIQTNFDAEWVLIEDPVLSPALEVQGGTVLCHSKDRDEVYRHARKVAPRHSAIVYTGQLPDDAAVVL
jgi:hypothetical protein